MKFTKDVMVTVNQRDQIMYDNNNGTTNAQVKNNWREIVDSDESTKIFEVKAGRPPQDNLADNRNKVTVYAIDDAWVLDCDADDSTLDVFDVSSVAEKRRLSIYIADIIAETLLDDIQFGAGRTEFEKSYDIAKNESEIYGRYAKRISNEFESIIEDLVDV